MTLEGSLTALGTAIKGSVYGQGDEDLVEHSYRFCLRCVATA